MSHKLNHLALLIRELARALRTADPGSKLPHDALDYLRRAGLDGKPLRQELPK